MELIKINFFKISTTQKSKGDIRRLESRFYIYKSEQVDWNYVFMYFEVKCDCDKFMILIKVSILFQEQQPQVHKINIECKFVLLMKWRDKGNRRIITFEWVQ